ncbi:MAG: fluoride efflux transporter CrcB [Methylotenera sp.]|nr:fluoride efflux transporter CrcB [Methylotenera sp.]
MLNFTNAAWIALGATLGAWARWGLGLVMNAILPNLPLGTLLANLSGGLLMGIALGLMSAGHLESQGLKLLITTGFLGGLTTFSAFTGESLLLLQKHAYSWAAIHISSHVFGALLMAAIGFALVQYIKG